MILGAIIGDIVGSTREWRNIKTENFEMLPHGSEFTDDTVMTLTHHTAHRRWSNACRHLAAAILMQDMAEDSAAGSYRAIQHPTTATATARECASAQSGCTPRRSTKHCNWPTHRPPSPTTTPRASKAHKPLPPACTSTDVARHAATLKNTSKTHSATISI